MKTIIASVIGIFFLSAAPTLLYSQPGADSLLDFIQQNKSRSSFFLRENDTVIARLNEDKVMPLASTVKIIVAIEFAKQAAHNVFSENKRIPVAELEKYYIPNTDGNAHPNWLNYERSRGNIINDSVKLIDVAIGMMMFNTNANSEYLMDLLGVANVKSNIQLLGLKKHTPIFPITSSLFLYQNPRKLNEDKILKEIKKLSDEDYARVSSLILLELKNDSTYKKKFRPRDLTLKMQKEWSDRLPASTTKEYVQLCSILNHRKYFDENTYRILATMLETLTESPAFANQFVHAGLKDGSTGFVLTTALYATLKTGTKIEMAVFFNDLTDEENARLRKWMNTFDLKVLTVESFRKQIIF